MKWKITEITKSVPVPSPRQSPPPIRSRQPTYGWSRRLNTHRKTILESDGNFRVPVDSLVMGVCNLWPITARVLIDCLSLDWPVFRVSKLKSLFLMSSMCFWVIPRFSYLFQHVSRPKKYQTEYSSSAPNSFWIRDPRSVEWGWLPESDPKSNHPYGQEQKICFFPGKNRFF